MKKTVESKIDSGSTDHFSTAHVKSPDLDKNYLFIDKEQTIFLTSLIGTQLLLTAAPPDYPIMKATEVVTEEIS